MDGDKAGEEQDVCPPEGDDDTGLVMAPFNGIAAVKAGQTERR